MSHEAEPKQQQQQRNETKRVEKKKKSHTKTYYMEMRKRATMCFVDYHICVCRC